ncbi:hypothetical protein ACFVZH_39365 [Streptomyces sp. NPDC059534]|uniref:hypothetical protein n=1 Tax=Streptomyces sp. NPDC059534 TaxID=3346859 RepID=UPI00369FF885
MKLAALASLANVVPKVAYEARDRKVLLTEILTASDALPLRTFDALRRISWPGENIARNTRQRLRLWESLAIEQSRLNLESVPKDTGLVVHPAGVVLTERRSSHLIEVVRLAEEGTPYVYLPLGRWAEETLEALHAEDAPSVAGAA